MSHRHPYVRLSLAFALSLAVASLVACAQKNEAATDAQPPVRQEAGRDDRPMPAEPELLAYDALADEVRRAPPPPPPPMVGQAAQETVTASAARKPGNVHGAPVMFDKRARIASTAPAAAIAGSMGDFYRYQPMHTNTENYAHMEGNPVKQAAAEPVSTFSVDVDTGAYSNVRRYLNQGSLPPADAVRVEELVNYFDYAYQPPADKTRPFAVSTEVARTPWNPDTYLLKVGLKGYEAPKSARPPANLVFLIDVSGSMNSPDKLPLLVSSLKMLTGQLRDDDRISMVVYAGAAGVVLEPTKGSDRAAVIAALEQLQAGGSTAGGQGISLAYATAQKAFIKGGINRIILATDGDFNVGDTRVETLKDYVARQRSTGVSLSVLGFGTGNLNDEMTEQLSNVGNGSYAYIDNIQEARKVLVEQVGSTLFTIARDTKIQIEFNPAVVAEYRLIGYENRMLRTEDFNNDRIDAGDIGAGHKVTALYEVALVGGKGLKMDPLRYSSPAAAASAPVASEFAFVKLRYKLPGEDASKLIEIPLARAMLDKAGPASADFKFAAAVAAFGQKLRHGDYLGDFGYDRIARLAQEGRGSDTQGYRVEFVNLVKTAAALDGGVRTSEAPPAD
ncbi:MAG: von Willebrand factor type A domain-containing protein [Sphingomonadales bacterium]